MPENLRPSLQCVLVYDPEDGERQEFPFDPFKLNSVDAEDLEDLGPWDNYGDFGQRLLGGNRRAIRSLFWVMRRHTEPALTLEQVQVQVGDLRLEFPEDDETPAEPEGNGEPGDGPTDSP